MRFLLAMNDSVLIALNITSHVLAQDIMVLRSMLLVIHNFVEGGVIRK